jgi:type I pantothenate kinase
MVRFRALRASAFTDPKSFFRRLAEMPTEAAEAFGLKAWDEINLPNLRDNIFPTRGRADLILRKGANHAVEEVQLRRV